MSQPSSTTDHVDDRYSEQSYPQQEGISHPQEDDGLLTLRSLVSTKEAGVIIGKGTLHIQTKQGKLFLQY